MIHHPNYNDYSSLIVLALGFNLAYIVVENIDLKRFFRFLNLFNHFQDYFEKIKKGIIEQVKVLMCGEDLSASTTEKTDAQYLEKFEDIEKKINSTANKYKNKLSTFSNPKEMHLSALLFAIYSFYVLISAPYECKDINFNASLVPINILLLIGGMVLVVFEQTSKKKMISAFIFFLCLFLSLLFIYGSKDGWGWIDSLNNIFKTTLKILLVNNYWITALICFGCFIMCTLYFLIGRFTTTSIYVVYISAFYIFYKFRYYKLSNKMDSKESFRGIGFLKS